MGERLQRSQLQPSVFLCELCALFFAALAVKVFDLMKKVKIFIAEHAENFRRVCKENRTVQLRLVLVLLLLEQSHDAAQRIFLPVLIPAERSLQ
jgi:hypothetical protein